MSVFLLHFFLIFTKNKFLSRKISNVPLYPFLYLPALFFLFTGANRIAYITSSRTYMNYPKVKKITYNWKKPSRKGKAVSILAKKGEIYEKKRGGFWTRL